MNITDNLNDNIQILNTLLPLEKSFDFIDNEFPLGNTRAFFLILNGFFKPEILQQIFADLQSAADHPEFNCADFENHINTSIGYASVTYINSWDVLTRDVLSGVLIILVDGFSRALSIDVRKYPSRSVEEPDTERVTRGAKDGFVETLLSNVNLIRRRIRSSSLVFSMYSVGTESKTDVSIAYLEKKVNTGLLKYLQDTIEHLDVTTLTMGSKSLEELLLKKRWWHPLPSIHTTERPDVACSYLSEGHILILVDNSPIVLILPCTIFQFTQSPEDYYNNPAVGTYFRIIRFLCIPISLLLMPVFLLLTANYTEFSQTYGLLSTRNLSPLQLFIYVLSVEFILDLFRYSSAVNSGKLSGSLSIVGGLIISDIAVSLNWASVEVLFYGAVTLLASLSIASIEFGNAIRLYRIMMILATGFWGPAGFWISFSLVLLSCITTPTFGGFSYFWPLFPFNFNALKKLLFRSPTPKSQPVKTWNRGKCSVNSAEKRD